MFSSVCRQSFEPTEFVVFAALKTLQTQWKKVRWGRSTRLLLPVLRESILKLLWLKHQALMHGPVQKRDAVSRNIQRSLAMQTWQSKLAHAVNKALHCTCVNCSGLGLKAIAVCPAFICWRKCHCFGINLSCNTAIRKHSRNLLAKVTLFSVFTGAEIEEKGGQERVVDSHCPS